VRLLRGAQPGPEAAKNLYTRKFEVHVRAALDDGRINYGFSDKREFLEQASSCSTVVEGKIFVCTSTQAHRPTLTSQHINRELIHAVLCLNGPPDSHKHH